MAKNKEEAVSDVEEFHLADLLYPSAEKKAGTPKKGSRPLEASSGLCQGP